TGGDREGGGGPIQALDRCARLRHDKLRYTHRDRDAWQVGAARARQEQANGPACGWARPAGQRDRTCASVVSDLFGERLGPRCAGGVPGGIEPAARRAGRRGGSPTAFATDAGTRRRVLESANGTGP